MAEDQALQLSLPDVLRAIVRGDAALLNHSGWQAAALAVIDELEAAAGPKGSKGKGGGDGS